MEHETANLIKTISVMALPVIFAVVLHEVAHGYMASLKGDNTARLMGRLTLNPLAHIDWFGTILLPIMFYVSTGFLFAYAKPVPVNFSNLKNPRKDMALVAAAGPFTNILLATISAILFKMCIWLSPESAMELFSQGAGMSDSVTSAFITPLIMMLYFSVMLNVVLAVINLIPIPPADGGRIATGLLSKERAEAYSRIEPYGMILLVIILVLNPLGIIDWTIRPLINMILSILL